MSLNRVFACISLLLTIGYAFPNGSTSGPSCGTMKPKHGKHTASEQISPFRIFVEGPVVRSIRNTEERFAGRGPLPSAVQVRLISTAKSTQFKGFLLQAHNTNGEAIGYFEIPEGSPSKALNCPNNQTAASVTHVDSAEKTSVDFLWSPPMDFEGKLTFRATVVSNFKTFYTDIRSPVVTVTINNLDYY